MSNFDNIFVNIVTQLGWFIVKLLGHLHWSFYSLKANWLEICSLSFSQTLKLAISTGDIFSIV